MSVKRQDRHVTPAGGPIRTTDLVGTWVRTDACNRGIARAVVEGTEGGLRLRAFEAEGTALTDWGMTSIDALYASSPDARQGVGFTGVHERPSRVVEFHANLSKGLLILATLTTPRDGSREPPEFAREFFRKAEGAVAPASVRPGGAASGRAGAGVAGSLPVSPLLGRWRNTNSRTTSLSEVSFAPGEGGLLLHALGVGEDAPVDWGRTRAAVFVGHDGATEPTKMRAGYDFGFMEVVMHTWVKQGVLVIVLFNRFKDSSGRSNYLDREFFYREDAAPEPAP
jgi:hypothetical protein